MPDLVYREIPKLTIAEINTALDRNNPEEMLEVVISAAIYCEDRSFAEDLCVRLSSHPHFNVRGNAILGFAHIARIDERLDEATIKPIIQLALLDEHEFVRGQANAAKDDVEHYLGWRFRAK
jgi:hypothetical protein